MLINCWEQCLEVLKNELSEQQYNTWILPLEVEEDNNTLRLSSPNKFVLERVRNHYLKIINSVIKKQNIDLKLELKGKSQTKTAKKQNTKKDMHLYYSNLKKNFTFSSFVEGKSNQLAKAASSQVAQNPGLSYNPLFIYGGVGLGKTHLMHAIAHKIRKIKEKPHVVYLHSEKFVQNMVDALKNNAINKFKNYYRSLDALLIDDIQFFSGKERTQEEFFHTFNILLEGQQQVVLTCDRFPKEVDGLEERLKSRFSSGLTVAIEPPDLETRVAIIKKKVSELNKYNLSDEMCFFIANNFRSNIREIEGVLNRIYAYINLTGQPVTLELIKEALHDLIHFERRQISIENIQKHTAEYYNIRLSDILSKKRNRSLSRPRQLAMAISKELTSHSLPEIGDSFGGKDHTTVLHACRKIKELRQTDSKINEDYTKILNRLIS